MKSRGGGTAAGKLLSAGGFSWYFYNRFSIRAFNWPLKAKS